ncbi:adenylate kinase 2 [Grosmannia clavigera kw1407]|uniref:GTP:AMP phosphotransferase, mitochondrial n=1 Tax=Grosmannia clavigera (strain kw1407 / UAMH 11150) TaxID=655863 RepID=F0XS61_GROCL|nr:adenylate kinase 2 [Grosmannia clavigera kw1407]EFW99519.1 adenylate kinase 2 [Grosmannia clavigera kw1407]
MRLKKAARVILIGAPGVGKGTQSERLLRRFPQLAHLSSGDLLRHNVKTRTPLGIKVESTIKAGGLVPDNLILRLIRNELSTRGWLVSSGSPDLLTIAAKSTADDAGVATFLSQHKAAVDGSMAGAAAESRLSEDPAASFLLDGFPRTAAQAAQLDLFVPVNLAISLKTPFEVVMQRIASRWVHEPSGRVYNDSFNAPRMAGRDDVTGEPLVKRPDDSEAVYRTRYDKFLETSTPLLAHYADRGVLLEVEGMSSDEITPKLFAEFERRFVD